MTFAELCATTNFSFLRGASHPEEMVTQAKALGLAALGVADRNTLAGVVRAHAAAKEHGLALRVGARLVFDDGAPDVIVYPQDRAAYARLTRLLTIGNRRAPKGECWLRLEDLLEHAEGLRCIVMEGGAEHRHLPPTPSHKGEGSLAPYLAALRAACGQVWLAAPFVFDGDDRKRLRLLKELAARTGARLIATTAPLMHAPGRRPLLDVITCIREKTTLDVAGTLLAKNAERHLKPPREMARLYADAPEAVEETLTFAQGISFSLDHLRYEYPDETTQGFPDAQTALEALARHGARERYGGVVPDKVRAALARELAIVAKLNYAPYFLTVADIVRFARSPFDKDGKPKDPILCQGRGSAANSAICFCLGVTEVDPAHNELLFDRFVSEERNEPPDIDVDFEHERREEVIQYIYQKYGRHRAGLAATLICYRGRSAIREVAKVFGYSEDRIASFSKALHWWSEGIGEKELREQGLDVSDPRLRACMTLARELHGFPRHLSQHVGGFVITRERLDDVVPIQNAAMEDRTVVEWDKDDLEELGILKVDVLGLGMLTCLKKAFDMLDRRYAGWEPSPPLRGRGQGEGGRTAAQTAAQSNAPHPPPPSPQGRGGEDASPLSVFRSPTDPRVYAMLHRADSVGVFQVESRAQMSMLPRLRPQNFYDLVIEVAIVRPGPIQGGMVHPYLKRRQGLEPVTYPSKALEAVLKRTLGVPLFQEQAMQIAIVGAGFTPPQADKLRRAMATFKRVGTIGTLKAKFIDGMIANGYERAFAEASFSQIEGFGEYGFPESHAASFAILVYASCWLKCHYPDVFATALLNAQPMGFYAPAQIVRDAIDHGVEVRAIDVNASHWDNTLEPGPVAAQRLHARHAEMAGDIHSTHAMRLGFRQAKGLKQEEMEQLVARRGRGYDSVRDVWLRSGLTPATIERLADIDAFRSLGLDRRDALWAARGLNRVGGQEDLPLFAAAHGEWGKGSGVPSPLVGDGREGGRAREDANGAVALSFDCPPPPAPSPQGGGDGPRSGDGWGEAAEARQANAEGVTPSARFADSSPIEGEQGEPHFELPSMPLGEHVVEDYRTLGLTLKAHPCSLLRAHLEKGRAIKADALPHIANAARTRVAGLVLVRQRPGTASGVIFMTLEDETGIANIVVWPKLFERFRKQVLGGRLVAIDGPVQSESGVIHVIAERVLDWTPLLAKLSAQGPEIDSTTPTDEPRKGGPGGSWRGDPARHPRNVRINLSSAGAADAMPKGRNFH